MTPEPLPLDNPLMKMDNVGKLNTFHFNHMVIKLMKMACL